MPADKTVILSDAATGVAPLDKPFVVNAVSCVNAFGVPLVVCDVDPPVT